MQETFDSKMKPITAILQHARSCYIERSGRLVQAKTASQGVSCEHKQYKKG